MTLRVRPEARADILDAARWYEDRQPGLGEAFVGEIDAVFHRIAQDRTVSAGRTGISAWR